MSEFLPSLASCWNDGLLSYTCENVLDTIQNLATVIGAILIPLAIWTSTARREKKHATLNLISSIAASQVVVERLERLYQYRKYKEKPTNYIDPYEGNGSPHLIFDLIIVLNYFETACIEIRNKSVDEELVFKTCAVTLTGVRNAHLSHLGKITGIEPAEVYPNLNQIAYDWSIRLKAKPLGLLKIPDQN